MALPAPSPGTTVVVTGASSGIGEALARELARRGYGLTLVARRREVLEALADELSSVDVTIHAVDLANDGDRHRLVDALRAGPALAGVCNNAGTGAFGRLVEHSVDEEEAVFRVNALALFDLTNRLVRDMVARGEGAILNTASILAFAPIPHNATYAATKAFIASFSEALHAELARTGVSCTTVSPGPTRTRIFDRSGAVGAAGLGPGVLWMDPEDVARAAVDGTAAGRRTVVPGLTNKLAVLGYRFAPRSALLPVYHAAQSPRVRRFLLGDSDERPAE